MCRDCSRYCIDFCFLLSQQTLEVALVVDHFTDDDVEGHRQVK